MEKQNKEKLEKRLRVIQDLKNEYYIGTLDTLRFLRNAKKIYEKPKEVSNYINRRLIDSGVLNSYPATPERIVGLCRMFSEASEEANLSRDETNSLSEFKDFFEMIETRNNIINEIDNTPSWEYFCFSNEFFEKNCPENKEYSLLPYFYEANKNKINSDEAFKKEVINYIKNEEDNDGEIYVPEKFNEVYLKNLMDRDWKKELSKAKLIDTEKRILKQEKVHSLNGGKILEKIMRDQVDHRIEYRRMILCKWLEDEGIRDYEEAICKIEGTWKKRLAMLKELRSDFIAGSFRTKGELKNSIRESKFIRHLLGSDKNFTEKVLRN